MYLYEASLYKQQHEKDLAKFLRKYLRSTEPATRGFLQEKMFLETLQNSQENTCARVSFFNKVAGRPATLLKRGSDTGVFP